MGPPAPGLRELHDGLDAAFEAALLPLRNAVGPIGVLFSGGVDSSLLAWELRSVPAVVLCTMGCDGSADLAAGKTGAEQLGLPWEGLRVEADAVREAEERFSRELEGLPSVTRTVLLALALAIELASPPRLVCGQGVDELFLGYAHFRELSAADAGRRSREDLARLRGTDWPRTERIAHLAGKSIVAPYLSAEFEKAALDVPVELRLPGDAPKGFFREWAVRRGLPEELAARPKKAVQYGSGVETLLREMRRPGR